MTFFLVSKSTISGKITLFFQTFTLKIIKTLHFNHYLSDLDTIHPPQKSARRVSQQAGRIGHD